MYVWRVSVVNFNLGHILETTGARQFIFGIHIDFNEYYQEQQQISRMSALVTRDWPLKKKVPWTLLTYYWG